MKKEIQEMAITLTKSAIKPMTCGVFKEIKNNNLNLKSVIIDYQNSFVSNGFTMQDFRDFCDECDKLGFEVLPIEQSALSIMTHLRGKKLVIQEKS